MGPQVLKKIVGIQEDVPVLPIFEKFVDILEIYQEAFSSPERAIGWTNFIEF